MGKSAKILVAIVVCCVAGSLVVAFAVYQAGRVSGGNEDGPGVVKHFTDDNFQKEVVEASKSCPILVDFYTEWCMPCKMLDPILVEVAKELDGRAVIGKVDMDKNLVARRFGVSRIPHIFVIRDGEVKTQWLGVISKEDIVKILKQFGA
jgi:thioredoxin 1